MSTVWSQDTRFKRTEIVQFPTLRNKLQTEDSQFWKHLQAPVTIREYGPVQNVDVCPVDPYHVAVTGSSRVQIFNPVTNSVSKTLSKFREAALGGRFRSDGKLLCVGSDDGSVKIFDVASKTLLRTLSGHENPTHVGNFCGNKNLASFSDDKTVRIWDISTEEELMKFEKHTDYVRAGCVSPTSSDLIVSGSYDHSVYVWDKRQSTSDPVHAIMHGCPVECVLMLPNGTMLVTAGGNEVKIWDLLSGGNRLLKTISAHNKTVTNLSLARDQTRLVTTSLDRQLKFHEISTFKTVHSLSLPSPILSAAVAPDDSFICVGMSDGLVQFLHRRVPPTLEEREAERLAKAPFHKYRRFTQMPTVSPDDLVVQEDKKAKESRHDHFLRKFEYSKALDQVLKPYVMKKHPDYTYSVLRELQRRNGLRTAIAGRDEKSLVPLLQYLHRNITDARFSAFLIEVIDLTLELYASTIGTCPQTDRIFVDIRKRVDKETRTLRQLMMLKGPLDLVLTANQTKKSSLTCEERMLKQILKEDEDPYLFKLLNF